MDDTKSSDSKEDDPISRRYFLELVGGGAVLTAALGSAVVVGQYLSPNVLREPALRFKAGLVENFSPDSITLDKEQKVFIIRGKEGFFYAMSAVCTHLGCIANWKAEDNVVACPCHGSKFNREGDVVDGPAPRPLPRFSVTLDDQGQLVVDKSVIVGEDVILKV